MAKLDDFENTSKVIEYKTVPSGTYKFCFEKNEAKATTAGFKRYSLNLKVLNEGEYKGCYAFPSMLSGWATDKGEGNHLGMLRALLRVIVSQNLNNLKLKKFYDKILKEDLEVSEFFEEILESNILNGLEFEAKLITANGKKYTNKDGKEIVPINQSLDLSPEVELAALKIINESSNQ